MLQYETDKSSVYYQSIKNKSYNEYGKMDWGLANRIEELPRNDWGMIHGTQGQSFALISLSGHRSIGHVSNLLPTTATVTTVTAVTRLPLRPRIDRAVA